MTENATCASFDFKNRWSMGLRRVRAALERNLTSYEMNVTPTMFSQLFVLWQEVMNFTITLYTDFFQTVFKTYRPHTRSNYFVLNIVVLLQKIVIKNKTVLLTFLFWFEVYWNLTVTFVWRFAHTVFAGRLRNYNFNLCRVILLFLNQLSIKPPQDARLWKYHTFYDRDIV